MTELRQFYERWAAGICLALVGLIIGIRGYRFACELDATAGAFELDSGPQATLLYDRNGQLLFSLHEEQRVDRRLSEMSPSVEPAVLAAEDRNFRSHIGIDPKRIASAAWNDMKARRITQGASTITQQLVRMQALGRERTWSRKLREVLLALRIERRFTKDQILETYLNRIYFGDGYFGIQAAARGYFDKDALDLDDADAALLAGIIRCPTSCSPRNSLDRALARRNVVLRAMSRIGRSAGDATSEKAAPPSLADKRPKTFLPAHNEGDDVSGLYFIDAVRRELIARFGEGAVLRGGLRVYTTYDSNLQRSAEQAIATRITELETQKTKARAVGNNEDNPVEGGLVAIDPRSGDVLAVVGGRDFHDTPFNRAVQAKRQPGSAFKPILFAAALEQGYQPSALIDHIDTPIDAAEGSWLPQEHGEATSYTLRQALMISSNRAAARLLQIVGISNALDYAKRLGLGASLPPVPSLALGTAEVSLMDLTSAYGAFANDGVLMPSTLISRVEDSEGDTLWRPSRTGTRAVRPTTAFLMSTMLADVLERGTGAGVRASGFKLPAGGKTGTTDSFADAWFIGYTPSLVAGVWFGRDRPDQIVSRGFAATVAVPAWARFMKEATAGAKPDWFPVPADLEKVAICTKSGLQATSACRQAAAYGDTSVVVDYFVKGRAPKEWCAVHVDEPILPGVAERPDAPITGPIAAPVAP